MLQRLRNAFRSDENSNGDKDEDWGGASPIKLRSTGYKRGADGSVTLSVTLDKDQVECCVCLSSMTDLIFRCRAPGSICHNVCGECEWQMRRMKSANGHTKEPKCPICKAEGTFVRNRSLERQLQEISSPCRNHKKGCKVRFFPWDESSEEEHSKMCMFDPIQCLICNRCIAGGRKNFVAHLRAPTVPLTPYEISVRNSSPAHEIGVVMDELVGEEEEDDRKENESDESVPPGGDSPQPSVGANNGEEQQSTEESGSNVAAVQAAAAVPSDGANQAAAATEGVIGCGLALTEANIVSSDTNKMSSFVLGRENTFVVHEQHGFVLLFLAPDEHRQAWKVFSISVEDYHLVVGNNRVYLQYMALSNDETYREAEANMGLLGESLVMPPMSTLSLAMNRLQNVNFIKGMKHSQSSENADGDDSNSKSAFSFNDTKPRKNHVVGQDAPFQHGYIFAGSCDNSDCSQMRIRLFTLTESFKVGAIIDARDFMGKWYQAEIIKISCRGCSENSSPPDESNGVPIRRIKVHYLGYSANYDEWLDVDTDSHRMAQRGTFTVGPDLRALRRYAQHQSGHVPLPRVLARQSAAALANISESD